MVGWICPNCQRSFGRRNQSHECIPGMPVDEYFEQRAPWERAIFDEVAEHLELVGDVLVEAVDVGVFFKRVRDWLTEAYLSSPV